MKKVLMAAVALICMSICVASCSSDEENSKRYDYGVWGEIALAEELEITEGVIIDDYFNAINSVVGKTGKMDDLKVIDACDKVCVKHTADYGDKISGTIHVYRVEEGSEHSKPVKNYTYHGTN